MKKKVVAIVIISLILVALLVLLVREETNKKISGENATTGNISSNISGSISESPLTTGNRGGNGGSQVSDEVSENESIEKSFNRTNESAMPTLTENYACEGCELENNCYPVGYRTSEQYCSGNYEFVNQLEADESCENDFECKSDICIDGKCLSQNFLEKIIEWFTKIF